MPATVNKITRFFGSFNDRKYFVTLVFFYFFNFCILLNGFIEVFEGFLVMVNL